MDTVHVINALGQEIMDIDYTNLADLKEVVVQKVPNYRTCGFISAMERDRWLDGGINPTKFATFFRSVSFL